MNRAVQQVSDAKLSDRLTIAAAVFAIFGFGLSLGFIYPLLSLVLAREGVAVSQIGWNAATMGLGVIASTLALPALTNCVSPRMLVAVSFIGGSVVILSFAWTQNLWVWTALRFSLGFCAHVVFVLTEAWVNSASNDSVRGRVVAIYTTGLSAGFAIGPLGLVVTGTEGVLPYAACSMITLLSGLLFTVITRDIRTALAPVSLRAIGSFFKAAPLLLAMVMVFGFTDWVGLSIMPLYFLEVGLLPTMAALTVTVAHVGMIVLQIPIGFALDHFARLWVGASCAAIAAISAALLIVLPPAGIPIWICVFALGGFSCGVYTAALAILGRSFGAGMLVAGSTVFSLGYTIAGTTGLGISGAAMGAFGASAAPALLVVLFSGLAAVLTLSRGFRL